MELWIRGRDLKVSVRKLNGVLKEVNPLLCNHGLRSHFKKMTRSAGLDHMLGEALMMHKLPKLEDTYGGDGFPDDALNVGAECVWEVLREIIN